ETARAIASGEFVGDSGDSTRPTDRADRSGALCRATGAISARRRVSGVGHAARVGALPGGAATWRRRRLVGMRRGRGPASSGTRRADKERLALWPGGETTAAGWIARG